MKCEEARKPARQLGGPADSADTIRPRNLNVMIRG